MVTTATLEFVDKKTNETVITKYNIPCIMFGNKTLGMQVRKSENNILIAFETITSEEANNYSIKSTRDFTPEAMLNFPNKESLAEMGEYLLKLSKEVK